MTREGYDVEHLISILKDFRHRHPQLKLILEPGSAFAWRTGELVSTVEDIVENAGVKTAMLNGIVCLSYARLSGNALSARYCRCFVNTCGGAGSL